MRARVIVALLTVAVLAACDRSESALVTAAIAGGTPSDEESVVGVTTTTGIVCSGVVIGPRHVLTSKACLYDSSMTGASADQVRVLVGAELSSARMVTVSSVVATDGPFEFGLGANNLAVLVLESEVGVPALPLASSSPHVGDTLTVIGHGPDESGASGTRREAAFPVNSVENGQVTSQAGSVSTCRGDGGGPGLNASGEVAVISLAAYGDGVNPLGCPAVGNIFIDVAFFRMFIDDALAEPTTDAGLEPADAGAADASAASIADAGPAASPSSCSCRVGQRTGDPLAALGGLGILASLARRRRARRPVALVDGRS